MEDADQVNAIPEESDFSNPPLGVLDQFSGHFYPRGDFRHTTASVNPVYDQISGANPIALVRHRFWSKPGFIQDHGLLSSIRYR